MAKTRLLIVEDDADTRTLYRYLLEDDYDLHMVGNVREALVYRLPDRSAGSDRPPAVEAPFDLLIIDLMYRGRELGIDLLHELRSRPGCTTVPALAVTAYVFPGERARVLDAGFDGYLAKPFSCDDLRRIIDRLVHPDTT